MQYGYKLRTTVVQSRYTECKAVAQYIHKVCKTVMQKLHDIYIS